MHFSQRHPYRRYASGSLTLSGGAVIHCFHLAIDNSRKATITGKLLASTAPLAGSRIVRFPYGCAVTLIGVFAMTAAHRVQGRLWARPKTDIGIVANGF